MFDGMVGFTEPAPIRLLTDVPYQEREVAKCSVTMSRAGHPN
jgi:hypothetical protein